MNIFAEKAVHNMYSRAHLKSEPRHIRMMAGTCGTELRQKQKQKLKLIIKSLFIVVFIAATTAATVIARSSRGKVDDDYVLYYYRINDKTINDEYQITVNGTQQFFISKRQRKMRLDIGVLLWVWCWQKRTEKCESKAKCKKILVKLKRLQFIFCILFRVSRANSFFPYAFDAASRVNTTQHAHTNKSCHLIWFVRCWFRCILFFVLDCIKRNEILGISAFSFVGHIFFWVLREHKWKPRAEWPLDLCRLWLYS